MQKDILRATWLFFGVFTLIFGVSPSGYSQFGLERKATEQRSVEEEDDSDQFDLDDYDADENVDDFSQAEKPPADSGPKVKGQNGPKLGKTATKAWETGVRLQAVGRCTDIVTMITIPMDWPEQKVTIMEEREKTSSNIGRIQRVIHKNGGLQVMVVKLRELAPGKTAEAALVVRVTRHEILPPDPASLPKLSIPPTSKIPRAYKIHLDKSLNIESNNTQFRRLYTEITKGTESDWAKIEAVYNYVRDTIQYDDANKEKIGNSALETLKLKRGDCKEMAAVFIAICRAGKVPARSVRVPGHCYVEFYMIDDDGIGYWFPCQIAGTYAFGGIPEMGPILQKGDNFTFPEFPREQFRFFDREVIGQHEGPAPKREFFENPL